MQKPSRARKSVSYALLFVIGLSVIIPFGYIVLISFGKGVVSSSAVLPNAYTLDNYARLFRETQFGRWLLSSIILALSSMILATLLCCAAAYVFERYNFHGKKGLLQFFLLLQVFPLTLSMVSINKLFQTLGLLNKLQGLVLIDSVLAAAGLVFIAMGYVRNLPYSLDEAAMIDGANRFQVFTRILLPLLRPMLVFVGIQSFVLSYTEYVIANVVMTEGFEKMPLAVGLQSLIAGQFGTNWSMYCAGAVLGSLPMLLLFYFLQRNYISGVSEGSVKG